MAILGEFGITRVNQLVYCVLYKFDSLLFGENDYEDIFQLNSLHPFGKFY